MQINKNNLIINSEGSKINKGVIMTLTTFEVTISGRHTCRIETIKAKSEDEARLQFSNQKIIAVAPLNTVKLGKISLSKNGVIA